MIIDAITGLSLGVLLAQGALAERKRRRDFEYLKNMLRSASDTISYIERQTLYQESSKRLRPGTLVRVTVLGNTANGIPFIDGMMMRMTSDHCHRWLPQHDIASGCIFIVWGAVIQELYVGQESCYRLGGTMGASLAKTSVDCRIGNTISLHLKLTSEY